MDKNDLFFVQKIYELSKKLNGNITVSSKDDAANLYAYLKGYTSWAEMSLYEKNKSNDFDSIINNENGNKSVNKIKEKTFEEKQWEFNNNFLKTFKASDENKFYQDIGIFDKKTNMLFNTKIGEKKIIKSFHPVYLNNENTLIISENNNVAERLLVNQIRELIEYDKSAIVFGLKKSGYKKELNHTLNVEGDEDTLHLDDDKKVLEYIKYLEEQGKLEEMNKDSNLKTLYIDLKNLFRTGKNIHLIGKGEKIINPMRDLFDEGIFENFFDVMENEELIFPAIWMDLIRLYKEQLGYKITPLFLKESLKVENLIQMMTNIDNNLKVQIKPLFNYINKYLGVVYVKEKQNFILSVQAQEKHYKQTYYLLARTKDLLELFDKGYFSEESDISFSEISRDKDKIVVLACEDEKYRDTYNDLMFQLIAGVINKQKDFVNKSNFVLEHFTQPLIVTDINDVSKKSMEMLNVNKDLFKTYIYDISPNKNNKSIDVVRNIFINEISQILFLKQNIDVMNKLIEEKIKNKTVSWGVNLFYGKYNILRTLSDYEALLWQKDKGERVLDGLEDCILEKIFLIK